jgi:hypothetical protein
MTQDPELSGRLDDEQEAAATSDSSGAAASGEYDASEGSPGGGHPTGEAFPDEAVRYDDPDARPRSDTDESVETGE